MESIITFTSIMAVGLIFKIVSLIIDLISIILIGLVCFCVFLLIFKIHYKKKGKRKVVKQIEELESQMKRIGKKVLSGIWSGLSVIMIATLCSLLAIAAKPILYKINYPLGEGYATFASYILAIWLWIMLRPNTTNGGSQ